SECATTEPVGDGLVGCWEFDEGSGSTAGDCSGNGNHGTLVNGPIWGQGSLTFDGIDDYVDCGSDNSLDITNEITISAWVNPASFPTNYNDIVSKKMAYYFAVDSSGRLKVLLYPLTQGWFTGSSAISGPTHVVMRYDGSKLRLYVNNILDSEGNVSGSINTSTHNLFIAGCQNNSKTGALVNRHFNGSIDNVKIFDKALSVQEIEELYNEGVGI
ncbi:MAG: LamG domain-containing protein, partial [Gammaproteobacteria bacterium]